MDPIIIASIYIVGALTALMQAAVVIFVVLTITSLELKEWLHERLGSHGALAGLILVGGSIVGSLFFSEVANLPACFLCLVERSLMYPQILLFGWYLYGRGLHRTHRGLLYAALGFSILGFVVSGYHVLLENGIAPEVVSCETLVSSVSCAIKYFQLFGYLTIPVMSLTVFVALIIISLVVLRRKHWLPRKAQLYGEGE